MGIPSELRNAWANRRESSSIPIIIPSPKEETIIDQKKSSIQVAVQEAFKTASIGAVVAAVPTLIACRTIPWAKANINHTGQALIISAAAISSFFITADKSILGSARENTMGKDNKTS